MLATGLKKSWHGGDRGLKKQDLSKSKNKVFNMISYKIDVIERLSEVKMGRGSPICERVHKDCGIL